jgi:4-amino-4-deoxy-L-arabinose transferase-like glycosyltransferase
MRPLTALVASLAVALPWYVWVGLRTDGAWLEGFLLEHHVGRATRPMEGHGGGPWYYPVAVLFGFFPWSLFLTPLLIDLVARIRRRGPCHLGYVFVACWIGVYVGVFSLARTKLPSYVTPMYPALALATGCFIYHWTRDTALGRAGWTRASFATLAAVGIGMVVAMPLAARVYLPGDEWLGVLGLVPLVGGVACYFLVKRDQRPRAARVFAAMAIVFVTVLFGPVAARVSRHQQIGALLAHVEGDGQAAPLATFGCHEPSWVFYAKQSVPEFSRYEAAAAADFLSSHENPFLITTDKRLEHLKPSLPQGFDALASAPFFLKRSNLVLVGRKNPPVRTADNDTRRTSGVGAR